MNDQARTNPELIHEISALKQRIQELQEAVELLQGSEQRFRQFVKLAPVPLCFVNKEGALVYFNDRFTQAFGYTHDEIPTIKEWGQLAYPDDTYRQWVFKTWESAVKLVAQEGRDIEPIECNVTCKNGAARVILISGIALDDNFLLTLIDITERKRAEEELIDSEKRYRELSIIDDLTQLYNSRYFYHQLKIEIGRVNRYEGPLTILFLDLDNFKAFNDAYGHVNGDQVLLRFGQVVKRRLRQTDSAYRYGGEEFTILLPMTTSESGSVMAERIRKEFKQERFSPDPDKDIHMTVSIGIAQYKIHEDMESFIQRVDQLMYQAKKSGKDRVCSEP